MYHHTVLTDNDLVSGFPLKHKSAHFEIKIPTEYRNDMQCKNTVEWGPPGDSTGILNYIDLKVWPYDTFSAFFILAISNIK